jgi:hypothetical protein
VNALASIQDIIYHILRYIFDNGVSADIDDILIYAIDEKVNNRLVEDVLK